MANTTIISSKSVYVYTSQPDTNYNSAGFLLVGTYPGNFEFFYSLIEFDLSTCPVVKTALLYINAYEFIGVNVNNTVARNTTSWVEATVTWNTKPAMTGNYGSVDLTSTGVKSLDVTNLVKEWKAETYPNYGLTITASALADNRIYCRDDEYVTEAERPRLVIAKVSGGIQHWFFCDSWQKHDRLWTPKLAIPKDLEFQI